MELLTLYSGALLPWLGGTFWLMFAEARFNQNASVNRFRQAGYGFFLGYAVLYLAIIISDKLTGEVAWPNLMVFLLLFSIAGAIATRLSPKPENVIPPVAAATLGAATLGAPAKALLLVAMVLLAIHAVFIAVEIFTQPIYPWDAWLAWVYRAKAWFLAGDMTSVVGPVAWAETASADIYTIDAWNYPLFPSAIPYWAALSLGRWSETLVNLPVLFAGLAMGMALYGQCREHGLNIRVSLIACYILFSIPLLGTHLALAGYADIWMAGFAGLGFVAVMRGIMTKNDSAGPALQTVLGLLMILFSIWVKNEGAVWLLAALAMIILATCRPRDCILIITAAVLVVLSARFLDFGYLDVPLIGRLGFVDGSLVIPFIGRFRLETHDVLQVYWDNFFTMGSWNLLWVAVAGSLLPGFRSLNRSSGRLARRTALSLIMVFLAVQLFIFGFTDQGLWADTYTAINRLPIHFVPALLFAVLVIAHAGLDQRANTAIGVDSKSNGD